MFSSNRPRAAVTYSGLILIQASSAVQGNSKVAVLSNSPPEGGSLDEFYTQQHKQCCDIDLHMKAMDVCIRDQAGAKLVQKNLPTTPEAFLRVLAPYREDVVVGVEGIFPW